MRAIECEWKWQRATDKDAKRKRSRAEYAETARFETETYMMRNSDEQVIASLLGQ